VIKNKKSFLYLTIIVTITLVFCTGCFFTLGQDPYDDALDELIDASKNAEDKEKVPDTATPTPEPTNTPLPPWTFVDEYELPEMNALDEFTNIMGLSEEEKQKLDVHLDIAGNNVWAGAHKPENFPESAEDFSDIRATGRFTIDIPPGPPWPINAPFTCGYVNPNIPARVVCPYGLDTSGTDRWHVGVVVFGADIPYNHPTRYGTINWPLVTEPDTDNRFVPHPEYPNDYYNGTQYWPGAWYEPEYGWEAAAYDSSWHPVDMNFFWIFYRNLALIFISGADVVLEFPSGRATVDWVIPDDWQRSFSGDVEQGDANLDPIPWMGGPQVFEYKEKGSGVAAPEGYERCKDSGSGCMMDREARWDPGSRMAACVCQTCTQTEGCECILFVDTNPWDVDTPYNAHINNFEILGENHQSVDLDPALQHWCTCLSKTGE